MDWPHTSLSNKAIAGLAACCVNLIRAARGGYVNSREWLPVTAVPRYCCGILEMAGVRHTRTDVWLVPFGTALVTKRDRQIGQSFLVYS